MADPNKYTVRLSDELSEYLGAIVLNARPSARIFISDVVRAALLEMQEDLALEERVIERAIEGRRRPSEAPQETQSPDSAEVQPSAQITEDLW